MNILTKNEDFEQCVESIKDKIEKDFNLYELAAYGDEKMISEVIRLCSTISKWIKAGGFRQKIK